MSMSVIEHPIFTDAPIPQDTTPPVSDVEYPCVVCGVEAGPYSGRGPKPKRCESHKTARVSKGNAPKVTGTNSALAAQATKALSQINGFMVLGAMVMGMHRTAGAIANYSDTFEEQTHAALVTDPDLCRYILRGGVQSAKIALTVSYLMFGAAVVPTALDEYKEKKAERDAAKERASYEQ